MESASPPPARIAASCFFVTTAFTLTTPSEEEGRTCKEDLDAEATKFLLAGASWVVEASARWVVDASTLEVEASTEASIAEGQPAKETRREDEDGRCFTAAEVISLEEWMGLDDNLEAFLRGRGTRKYDSPGCNATIPSNGFARLPNLRTVAEWKTA